MHKTLKAGALVAGTLLALGTVAPAAAAPGEHGQGAGGCIDQLYGNATNERESGHGVLPAVSPGPWALDRSTGEVSFGITLGEVIKLGREAGYELQPAMQRGECIFQ